VQLPTELGKLSSLTELHVRHRKEKTSPEFIFYNLFLFIFLDGREWVPKGSHAN
jgi:hypothetical protein